MNKYSPYFYDSVSSRAQKTAIITSDIVSRLLTPQSMVDIGSGLGIWSKVFLSAFPSMTNLVAIDLERHKSRILDSLEEIPAFNFLERNLESVEGLPDSHYDLAICVEVLEHVSPKAAQNIFDEFSKKCSFIVFGAAIKGQGGTHHINEQSFEFWTNEMLRRGLIPVDVFRPQLLRDKQVPGYYKYNMILWFNPNLASSDNNGSNFADLFSSFPTYVADIRPFYVKIRYWLLSWVSHKGLTRLATLIGALRRMKPVFKES